MFHQTFTLGVFFVAVAHLIIDESSNTDSIRFVKMFNSQTALAALVWCCTPKIRAGSMTCYGPTLPSEKKRANGFAGFLLCLAWSKFIVEETAVNAFFLKEDEMYICILASPKSISAYTRSVKVNQGTRRPVFFDVALSWRILNEIEDSTKNSCPPDFDL